MSSNKAFSDIVNSTHTRVRGQFGIGEEGIIWRPGGESKLASKVAIRKDNILGWKWTNCGDYGLLHVTSQGEDGAKRYERFDGFKRRDVDVLKEVVRDVFGHELERESLSGAGLNAGTMEIQKERKTLQLKYEDQTALELPLKTVVQCVAPGKNDIEMHFEDDESGAIEDEILVEMKFYVPPNEDGANVAEAFQKKLVSASGVEKAVGDEVCRFDKDVGKFMAPSGKYDVLMYDSHFRMLGKTYEYKIKYKSITSMFLLEKPEETHNFFVISLAEPIQQGQQRYKHLVMQLEVRDDTFELNLNNKEVKERVGEQLQVENFGQLPTTIAKIFKVLSDKKVYKSSNFSSFYEKKAVKANLKSANGLLYPLQRALFYLHKPATYIRYEDVKTLEFQRYNPTLHNFNIEVVVRSVGGEPEQKYLFSGIDRSEYKPLFAFLSGKKIKIMNLKAAKADAEGTSRPTISDGGDAGPLDGFAALPEMEEESDDDDFEDNDEEASDSDSDSSSGVSLVSEDGMDVAGTDDEDDEGDDASDGGTKVKKEKKSAKVKTERTEKKKRKRTESGNSASPAKPVKEKKKQNRDPDAPKAAQTPYFLFQQEKRPEIQAAEPDLSFGEISKKVGAMWKALSDEDKQKYVELHQKEVERVEEELKNYTPKAGSGYGADGILIKEEKKAKRDPNAPSRAMPAYQIFRNDKSAELQAADPNISFGDISKKISTLWKEVSAEEKEKYEKLHKQDVDRAAAEFKAYTPPEGYDDKGKLIVEGEDNDKDDSSSKPQKKKRQKKDKNAPKKASTAYLFFSNAQRQKYKSESLPLAEMSKRIGAEWKVLSSEDKKPFEEMAAKDKLRYEEEMAAYKPTDTASGATVVKAKKEKKVPVKKEPTTAKVKAEEKDSTAISDSEDEDDDDDDDDKAAEENDSENEDEAESSDDDDDDDDDDDSDGDEAGSKSSPKKAKVAE